MLLVSSWFAKTLWIISDLPSDHSWPFLLTFWMACTQRPAGTFGGICHRLGKLGLSKKSPEFTFQNRFNKKQNPPDSFLKSLIISEHPKILQILSIRLTDWKLSKRNRPKVASNSCQRQKNTKCKKSSCNKYPALTLPPQKKNFRMAQQRCVRFRSYPCFCWLSTVIWGCWRQVPQQEIRKVCIWAQGVAWLHQKILPTLKLPQERLEHPTAKRTQTVFWLPSDGRSILGLLIGEGVPDSHSGIADLVLREKPWHHAFHDSLYEIPKYFDFSICIN